MCVKQTYKSIEEAESIAKKKPLGNATLERYNTHRVYQCSNCLMYHITRNLKTIKKHRKEIKND